MKEKPSQRSKPNRKQIYLAVAGAGLFALVVVTVGSFLVWHKISSDRQKARAEEAVRKSLDGWCANKPLDQVRGTNSDCFFDDPGMLLSSNPRPKDYQITGVRSGKDDNTFEVSATLNFLGGPETRVYEVLVSEKSNDITITTKASGDAGETEDHARSLLKAGLDHW